MTKGGPGRICDVKWWLSLVIISISACGIRGGQCSPTAHSGEFGGDLDFLRSCCSGPKNSGESNYYIDMLGGTFRLFANSQGFTNNHSLFVLSHGKALPKGFSQRYALYPSLMIKRGSYYSARDLAEILGPNAAGIQNIFLAGCNVEGAFTAKEYKKYFINATNIVHARPETDASVDGFENVFAHSSDDIKSGAVTTLGDFFSSRPSTRSKHNYYLAELYRPGEVRPYTKQVAGRELLSHSSPLQMAASTSTNGVARFPQFRRE